MTTVSLASPSTRKDRLTASRRPAADIYTGDCLSGMRKKVSDASIDVVVTSPPYNLGIKYKTYDDKRGRAEYLSWMGEIAREVKRVLSPGGSFFLNVGGTAKDPWVPQDVARAVSDHFSLQNQIVWIKSIAVSGRSVGHFKPVNSLRYLNHCHEFIFHFTHNGNVPLDRLAVGVPYQDKSNVGRWRSARADLRCRGNAWFIPYETVQSRRPHPATFPVELAEMCVKLHGLSRVSKVLDPFMGIGSTALACRRLEKSFVGFELDPAYVAEAKKILGGKK